MSPTPPSLFALSATVAARHDLLDDLEEDTKHRARLAARRLICVSPHCTNSPKNLSSREINCGLCLLPLCGECWDDRRVCDGCSEIFCRLCADTTEVGHADHHLLWDGLPRSHCLDGLPHPPNPSHCIAIECKSCHKVLCWMCWMGLHANHNPDNTGWMCDACHSHLCLDCTYVVDSVGLPKLAHVFDDVDVNVICIDCLLAERDKYHLSPNHNHPSALASLMDRLLLEAGEDARDALDARDAMDPAGSAAPHSRVSAPVSCVM